MACTSILLGAPGKKTREATPNPPPPPGNCLFFDRPFLFEFPLPSVEGGYGYFLEVHNLSIRS